MDDFGFEASVWATPSTQGSTSSPRQDPGSSSFSALSPSNADTSFANDSFGDDDFEFNAPLTGSEANGGDDFDDFGDFDLGDDGGAAFVEAEPVAFTSQGFGDVTADWEPLRLDPIPGRTELKQGIGDILRPFWQASDCSQFLTDEDIRQVGGLHQILVSQESRILYNTLFQQPPPQIRPPDWTRSRIRRKQLVSLGIPVNLDEVLPTVNGKAMPALSLTTRPLSAPPSSRILDRVASPPPMSQGSRPGSRAGSRPPSRPATPKASPLTRGGATFASFGLGEAPQIDNEAVKEVLSLDQDTFSLLPLSTLEKHLERVHSLTADTSALLTHLLQQRDALQQDSETYNKLIGELVGEAQKMKTGSRTRSGGTRRSSGMT